MARRTGLTVRTLHHYDEIGLPRPSLHTGSGHRLYTAADVGRLQQVKQALINEFTGGDSGIAQSLNRLWKDRARSWPPNTA